MVNYIRCPRCDLNYINADEQEFCDVCLAEMRGTKLKFADIDEDEFLEEEELIDEETELCPICGVNHIKPGEKMCEECRSKDLYDEEEDVTEENDQEWVNYLDEDEEDMTDLTVDEELLEEELEELDREDEEDEMYHENDEPDDFDESLNALDYDDDYDDDDDEDDGKDDEF
ncbi:MAG: hypothetical protein LUD47_02790 [Clostridia bacterium]|nr:hypothetical protein [Clostridia bacterium]